jgi:hypothetical protein
MRVAIQVAVGLVVLAIVGAVAFPFLLYRLYFPPLIPLFSYNIASTVAVSMDGRTVESRRVTRCEMQKGGGGITGADPNVVLAKRISKSNHEMLLPDGSALIFYDMDLCRWRDSPPSAGAVYELVATRYQGGDLAKSLGGNRWDVHGRVAWLADAITADRIGLYQLDELYEGLEPGLSSLSITAQLTEEMPTIQGSTIPLVPSSSEHVRYGDSPAWLAERTNVELRLLTAQIGQVASRSGRVDCRAMLASLATGTRWVPVDYGVCVTTKQRDAKVVLARGLERIEIDLEARPVPSQLAFSRAALIAKGVPGQMLRRNGQPPAYLWIQMLCIEGDCNELALTDRIYSHFAFYHPPTQRMATFSVEGASMRDFSN